MAGVLAKFYAEDRETAYFGLLGGTAIVLGVAMALLRPTISRLMSGVH